METIELPGTITVHDPEPVIAHMASYRAWADQHDVPFEATIERARAILVDHIAQHGLRDQVPGRHPRLSSLRTDMHAEKRGVILLPARPRRPVSLRSGGGEACSWS
ncbi:hypothetical protein AB5J56_01745 [Streptomyces sp. R21]|uniref:Uncharacterized protein n=1 Tax=Streptomyces sp. R21 TaxID=3238627 RepID=A0AB39P2W6_9ACTN